MARGFESKDVEDQQAEAERPRSARPALTVDERQARERRGTLELALLRARAELHLARSVAHRRMLTEAIGTLERQIAQIT
jgi:hypothetical protein